MSAVRPDVLFFFLLIFSFGISCMHKRAVEQLHAPSYDPVTKTCLIQDHVLLFSCAHENVNYQRLCPCRDFQRGQTALCQGCL